MKRDQLALNDLYIGGRFADLDTYRHVSNSNGVSQLAQITTICIAFVEQQTYITYLLCTLFDNYKSLFKIMHDTQNSKDNELSPM